MRRHPAALQRKAARSLQPPPPPAQKVFFLGFLMCGLVPLGPFCFFLPSSGGLEPGGTLRDTEGMKEGTDLGISGMGGGCQWQH